VKNEAAAMFAADAGYEKAVFWMSRQRDVLSALQQNGVLGTSGAINLANGDCDYKIGLFTFVGARPVYRVISNGHSGMSDVTVDVLVLQAMSGWDMGMCRVASGQMETYPVNFADGEIIDIPLHINKFGDDYDRRDIYISGDPRFLQPVAVSEPRYDTSGSDKYASGMGLFEGGIYFDQPNSRVTDEASIQSKVDRFRNSTNAQFQFKPVDKTPLGSVENPHPAVQMEFFVEGGIGKIRITDNCTVLGFQQAMDDRTWDFRIEPGSGGTAYQRHDIYAYHFISVDAVANGERFTRRIDQTYVTQSVGPVQSAPGGQIFVDGNVIIGGDRILHNGDQVVRGRITVVATGNIWIADSVVVDGPRDADGRPSQNNPNVLGLVAQGVIKIVDPGMSGYSARDKNNYPGPPKKAQDTGKDKKKDKKKDKDKKDKGKGDKPGPELVKGFNYVPIGRHDGGKSRTYDRHLPNPIVIEAAITAGGGGLGAENVERNTYGGRKEAPGSGSQNELIIRGTVTEAVRGVVELIGTDGYLKRYYLDERLFKGILPGDIWLQSKYIPAPAGWRDYRPVSQRIAESQ
jgi:hypothetical protein